MQFSWNCLASCCVIIRTLLTPHLRLQSELKMPNMCTKYVCAWRGQGQKEGALLLSLVVFHK